MGFGEGSKSRQKERDDEGSSTSDSDSVRSDHVSESLSDIEDADIAPYLLSKEEVVFKTIIWEAMNNDYVERRSTRKRGRDSKEAGPRRKAAKTSTDSEANEGGGNQAAGVKTGRSSKINYSALNEEEYGLEEGSESNEKVIRTGQSEEADDGKGYGDDYEYEHENQYNEEDETYYANDDDDTGDNDGWFDEF